MNENGVLWTTASALKHIFSSWKDEFYFNKNKFSCSSSAEAVSLSCQEIFCSLMKSFLFDRFKKRG